MLAAVALSPRREELHIALLFFLHSAVACSDPSNCTVCPGDPLLLPRSGKITVYLKSHCDPPHQNQNTLHHTGDLTFSATQNVTLYGGDAFLNGSIVSHGTLKVSRLSLTGPIRFHGSQMVVSSVRTIAKVAVVSTETTADIEISNTSGSEFIAAFANVQGSIRITDCVPNGPTGGVVIQGSENDPQDWAFSTASWDPCVNVHNVGTLLNVFGKGYEVVFYSGDFFSDTANLPTTIATYAAGVAMAGVVVLFLTHAGELTHIAHIFAARRTTRVDMHKKYH